LCPRPSERTTDTVDLPSASGREREAPADGAPSTHTIGPYIHDSVYRLPLQEPARHRIDVASYACALVVLRSTSDRWQVLSHGSAVDSAAGCTDFLARAMSLRGAGPPTLPSGTSSVTCAWAFDAGRSRFSQCAVAPHAIALCAGREPWPVVPISSQVPGRAAGEGPGASRAFPPLDQSAPASGGPLCSPGLPSAPSSATAGRIARTCLVATCLTGWPSKCQAGCRRLSRSSAESIC